MKNTPAGSDMMDSGFTYESMGGTPGASLLQSRSNMSAGEILKSMGQTVGNVLESGRDTVRNLVEQIMEARQPAMQPALATVQADTPTLQRQRDMRPF
ncbi:MAG: hypothetical protein KI792_03110 [Alphaproteobacteria bacterium]|nr:hypothetical protein [Alphaproteobacteria bacterium SS10]